MSESQETLGVGLRGGGAAAVGFVSLIAGLWWMFIAVQAPFWGITWWVLCGSCIVACFGTAYAACMLAGGNRPQLWPSRIAAGACFLVGGVPVGEVLLHGGWNRIEEKGGVMAFAGVMLLLGIAHGILSGDRPGRMLLLASVCAAILAYVCGPGYEFLTP